MRTRATTFFVFLLCLTQAFFAVAPGAVICIPLPPCDAHAALADDHHDCDHPHGPVSPGVHAHDDCACHLHVPLPDNYQLLAKRLLSIGVELPLFAIPVPAPLQPLPAPPTLIPPEPPDERPPHQADALRATRLLI